MGLQGFFCLVFLSATLSVTLVTGAEEEYQRVSRERHYELRLKHHVFPLEGSDDLNSRAVRCAQHYIQKGQIDHSCPVKNGAGENLWMQRGGNPTDNDAALSSTNAWYSEGAQHNFNLDFQPGTGHFTQLVWKNSRDLGFGVARQGNAIVGCALYSPAGNILGQFKDNVFPA